MVERIHRSGQIPKTEEISPFRERSGSHEEQNALPETIVTAQVLSAGKIEGSDHLQVCQVDYGKGQCQVVCGAANCQSGMKAILALPGTVLGDLTIKQTKLRGVESAGMLCSEKELGITENHEGIIELPQDTKIGESVNGLYSLPDTIFELEITPNRPDLLGYLGIAKDLSASTGKPLQMPNPVLTEQNDPIEKHLSVDVQDPKLCPRYTARFFREVQNGNRWVAEKQTAQSGYDLSICR